MVAILFIEMEQAEIKEKLTSFRNEARDLADRLETVQVIIAGMERLLELEERDSKPAISLRAAVIQVMRESQGEPLHVKEIVRRVEALGARVNGADKSSRVDLAVHSVMTQRIPVQKVATRTWQYVGGAVVTPRRSRKKQKLFVAPKMAL